MIHFNNGLCVVQISDQPKAKFKTKPKYKNLTVYLTIVYTVWQFKYYILTDDILIYTSLYFG